mmetsp:Transcript_26999/g.73252  ORF Transcript_26999/g.73252 Transcript_26999/m.73252 type:complete len:339 (-) Transcript_26999:469-1485(-)
MSVQRARKAPSTRSPITSISHLQEESLQQASLHGYSPRWRRVCLGFQRRDRGGDVLADLGSGVKEVYDIIKGLVLEKDHVLPQGLPQREEASLGVVPSVHPNLPLVRLQRLHDSADTKLEVALGAVEGADDQVDDAEVVDRLGGVRHLLLLLLHQAHELLGLLVRRGHDVGHAEVRQNDGRHTQKVVVVFPHEGLVVADALLELLLHEKDVRHVELPGLILAAKLCRLPEDLLDHGVVLHVPINLRLAHEHGDVLGKSLVELAEVLLHRGLVAQPPRILNVLRAAAQSLDVLRRELVEAPVGLLGSRLREDEAVEELVVLLVHALVSEVRVLCEDVCG